MCYTELNLGGSKLSGLDITGQVTITVWKLQRLDCSFEPSDLSIHCLLGISLEYVKQIMNFP